MASEKQKFNRQFSDYLLTDLLPYEKGNHFTHLYFYDFVNKNKKDINKIIKGYKHDVKFIDKDWHSAPLNFKISKTKNSFRQLSYINPLGLIESLVFMKKFGDEIISILSNKKSFSTRKPTRTSSLVYKTVNKQTVFYNDNSNEKPQLLITLESKGNFFDHKPFKTITKLLNSPVFNYQNDAFQYTLKFDVQDCFPSIYSHSFKWIIANKTYDSKALANVNSLYVLVDQFLQNLNGSKTNGIIVGPELSRLMNEFLFVHLDEMVIKKLNYQGYTLGIDYNIFRYVDDYFLFTNNKIIENEVFQTITEVLNQFHLKINITKKIELQNDSPLNEWLHAITPLRDVLDKNLLKTNENSTNYLLKYKDIRNTINVLIKNNENSSFICSYLLTIFSKKIEFLEEKQKINMSYNELISTLLYLYTVSPSYTSMQKIIKCLTVLIEKFPSEIPHYIERNIERFSDKLFTSHVADWIDILLFLSCYKINISTGAFEIIKNKVVTSDSPQYFAALSIYCESLKNNKTEIKNVINKTLEKKLDLINWKNFFSDELSWWVFILYSYPSINSKNKDLIKRNLIALKDQFITNQNKLDIMAELREIEILENEIPRLNSGKVAKYRRKIKDIQGSIEKKKKFFSSVEIAQNMIIDFLLTSPQHFIVWDFAKENYHEQFSFYTNDRTIFNPNLIDQHSISF